MPAGATAAPRSGSDAEVGKRVSFRQTCVT
jgi:hypothetical protein